MALAIPDLGKPARQWCAHALRPHGGCAVHHLKAKTPSLRACADFECLWLQSQRRVDPGDRQERNLRPNISHVMFGPFDPEDDRHLFVHVDPEVPRAWKEPLVQERINVFLERGAQVTVVIGETHVELDGRGH
jgi:hypothetical protein